jgi:hypothetical protein
MEKEKVLKIVGPVLTIVGLAVSLVKGHIDEINQNKLIDEKVAKAISEKAQKGGS